MDEEEYERQAKAYYDRKNQEREELAWMAMKFCGFLILAFALAQLAVFWL